MILCTLKLENHCPESVLSGKELDTFVDVLSGKDLDTFVDVLSGKELDTFMDDT